jgi:methionine-rich copper-binding protein CopC
VRARRAATVLLGAVVLLCGVADDAGAHAGLVSSEPAAGAELGAAPTAVRLTFSEEPEASLAEISVLDDSGAPQQTARPQAVSGDPLTLSVPVPRLERGVYTVDYRALSAVDGHATSGTFAFGVRASPAGAATLVASTTSDSSALEVFARWLVLLGLVVLIGASVAGAARFGGSQGTDVVLADRGVKQIAE